MSSICLDVMALFGAIQHLHYVSLGDTIVVIVGERMDVWNWVSNKGGWCLVAFEA